MATSGSVDYNLNRDEIIREALDLLGVSGISQSISDDDLQSCHRSLNNMVKAWQAQGIHLWTEQEATLFLDTTSQSYTLSSSGDRASNTVIETTISADEASGQTILSITDSTGMTAADVVGIEQDDGTMHWTTIASVDSSTQITVDDALTDEAASTNHVFSFTTKINRPLDIIHVRNRDDNNDDSTLSKVSREEYFDIINKDATGSPVQYYYDPQLSAGKIYIWPVSDSVVNRLKFTYRRSLEDFDAASDNPDFPQEWLEALIYNLAVRIAPKFNKEKKVQLIALQAEQFKQDMLDWDQEHGNVTIGPV